jgi:hypothetical protein
MHPYFAIVDGAPHKVYRTEHDCNPAAHTVLQSTRELLQVEKSRRHGVQRIDTVHADHASSVRAKILVPYALNPFQETRETREVT